MKLDFRDWLEVRRFDDGLIGIIRNRRRIRRAPSLRFRLGGQESELLDAAARFRQEALEMPLVAPGRYVVDEESHVGDEASQKVMTRSGGGGELEGEDGGGHDWRGD